MQWQNPATMCVPGICEHLPMGLSGKQEGQDQKGFDAMHQAMKKALAATLSIAVLTSASAASALMKREVYQNRTEEELAKLKISKEDVESVKIRLIKSKDDRGPEIRRAEGWVRLKFCTGHLVVVMNQTSFPLDTYTRGDCSVPGVKNR